MTRLGATITMILTVAVVVAGPLDGASAQLELPPLFPTTIAPGTPPPPPPPPTTTTTAPTASLVGNLLKAPPTTGPASTAAPAPTAPARVSGGTIPGNLGGEGEAPPPDAGPFPADLAAMMNSVRRSRPNNSNALVDALKILTDAGMSPEEAMRVGMGNFPVAGRANYSHDWWYPRFGPGWRLHQGTDVFATRGTPLRSPTTGTVSFSDGGLGGISVYITQADGTYFYLAHLDGRPPGLKPGQTVNPGDIVGYVGSTGNASGGSPHLHFEVHPAIKFVTVGKGRKATTKAVSAPVRPGTQLPAIDPKPMLDLYLQQAIAGLPAIAASYLANLPPPAPAGTNAVPVDSAAIAVAGRHLAVGGLIAAEAPLARTPLLLLAFLLIVMVLVLFPVLAPRARYAGAGPGPGRHAAEKRARKSGGKPPKGPSGNGSGPSAPDQKAGRSPLRRGRKPSSSAGPSATPPPAAPVAAVSPPEATRPANGTYRKPPGPPSAKPERKRRRRAKEPGAAADAGADKVGATT